MRSSAVRATDVSHQPFQPGQLADPAALTAQLRVVREGALSTDGFPPAQPFTPERLSSSVTGSEQTLHEPGTLRAANRAVTRQTLVPLYEDLLARRKELFRRSRREALSKKESTELRYLEWQIQRVEDADIGDHLDQLEALASAHERLQETVGSWIGEVRAASKRSQR
jgi:hypothetical protein